LPTDASNEQLVSLEIKGSNVLENEKSVYVRQSLEFAEQQINNQSGLNKNSTRSKVL